MPEDEAYLCFAELALGSLLDDHLSLASCLFLKMLSTHCRKQLSWMKRTVRVQLHGESSMLSGEALGYRQILHSWASSWRVRWRGSGRGVCYGLKRGINLGFEVRSAWDPSLMCWSIN
jgi:hypothetical protein